MVHIKKNLKKKGEQFNKMLETVGNPQVSKWSEVELQLWSGRFQIACSSYYICPSNRMWEQRQEEEKWPDKDVDTRN